MENYGSEVSTITNMSNGFIFGVYTLELDNEDKLLNLSFKMVSKHTSKSFSIIRDIISDTDDRSEILLAVTEFVNDIYDGKDHKYFLFVKDHYIDRQKEDDTISMIQEIMDTYDTSLIKTREVY